MFFYYLQNCISIYGRLRILTRVIIINNASIVVVLISIFITIFAPQAYETWTTHHVSMTIVLRH